LLAASGGGPGAGGGRGADLCTGAGAIAVHLMAEAPAAAVVGVDIDRRAVACARRNGVPAVVGDLAEALRSGVFDVVTAVAPYVPTGELRLLPADVQRYEPRRALDGGHDGLDPLRRIVVAAARVLRPGGWLLTEVGGEQDRALAPTLVANGFGPITTWFDDDGDLRGFAAPRTTSS
ncbi:MAG: N5-glutamine methyltransferase family protein, partial [Acidimicrobiales bacterium]